MSDTSGQTPPQSTPQSSAEAPPQPPAQSSHRAPTEGQREARRQAGAMLRKTYEQAHANGLFKSQNDFANAVNYRSSYLADLLSGNKDRQSEEAVGRLVRACMPDDPDGAQQRINAIVDVLREGHATPQSAATGTTGTGTVPPPKTGDESKNEQPPPRRSRTRLIAVAATVVLLLAVAGGAYYLLAGRACGADADEIGGQCIGYTDGSTNIAQNSDPGFTNLLGKIKAENDQAAADAAAAGGPVVAIAYTAPFPRPDATDPSAAPLSAQLLREIQGAYLVQLQANGRGPSTLAGSPRVQLLIANLGDQRPQSIPADATEAERRDAEALQRTMVGAATAGLITRADPENTDMPLVATVGFDQSFSGVADAITALGQAKIPMVAARLTADSIAANAYRNSFFAVSPSIKAQVAAASRYLGTQARRPMIVADQSEEDLYGQGIFDQLQPTLPAAGDTGRPLLPERYDSSKPGVDYTFKQMTTSICAKAPDTIYFAGRGAQLVSFIRALGDRDCQDRPFTVFTPSDGRILAEQIRAGNADNDTSLATALSRRITVQLTAQAHPDQWAAKPALFPPSSYDTLIPPTPDDASRPASDRKLCAVCYAKLFPTGSSEDDGDVIMGHDAMLVAVSALRGGVSQQEPTVTTGSVGQQLTRFTPDNPVRGASGPIGFDGAGFALNKDIPITQITADGRITLVRT